MMVENWMGILLGLLLYGLLALGILLLFAGRLQRYRLRLRLWQGLRAERQTLKEGPVTTHLRQLLGAVVGGGVSPGSFLGLLALLFLLLFLAGMQSLSLPAAVVAGALGAFMPYLLLRIRLENLRRRSSFEGEALVSEILRQYRIEGLNIYEALEQVVAGGEGIRHSRKLLYKLLLELRSTGTPERIRTVTEQFAYAIQTNWSRMLAHNIRLAAEKGTNVSLSMEDVLIQLREARALAEERKRLNSEASRMVLFLVPLMYFITVFLAVRYLEVPLGRFLGNQFGTAEGLLFFLLLVFLFLLNVAIMALVSGQRFDY